jgi:hypothetical protein
MHSSIHKSPQQSSIMCMTAGESTNNNWHEESCHQWRHICTPHTPYLVCLHTHMHNLTGSNLQALF